MVVDVAISMGFELKEMMCWRSMDILKEEIKDLICKESGGAKIKHG